MNISKEILEKAFKESIDNYSPNEDDKELLSFDDLEKSASEFSDSVMKRALEIALDDNSKSQKKTYVKSVEKFLSQLDTEKK